MTEPGARAEGTESPPALLRAITDDDKRLVFSFIRYLRDIDVKDPESVGIVSHILSEAFGVDPSGVGGTFDSEVDLFAIFKESVAKKQGSGDPATDEKFASFLELLKKKGYFNNCEEGSEEYQTRVKKAYAKYQARNNPYEGLTADQLKTKGNELMQQEKYQEAVRYMSSLPLVNELMQQEKYQEAVRYYTKAIELEPTNHIYYANRAAAHTYIKDYRSAILDCEKAISIDPKYVKAYSRLGNALYQEGQYRKAADVYRQAVSMDPENESYKSYLKLAEDQMASQAPVTQGGGGMGGMGGMPPGLFPPGFDMSQMNALMSNPQFMQSAMQMMQNPQFSQMLQQAAGQMGGSQEQQMEAMRNMMAGQGGPQVDDEGNIRTPMGSIKADRLKQLQEDEAAKNPKFRAIMEDVRINGMGAFQKYMGDPEVMTLMTKFMGMMEPDSNVGRRSD